MKRFRHLFYITLTVITVIAASAASASAMSDISLKSASDASAVKIEGSVAAGQWVSVKITRNDAELAYFNAQITDADGKYSFTADLSDFSEKMPLDLTVSCGSFVETAKIKLESGNSGGGSGGGAGGSGGGSAGGGSAAEDPSGKTDPVQQPDKKIFSDVKAGAWYESAVYEVVEKGLFTGVSDTLFAPDADMNRAMFVTVLGRLNGGEVSGSHSFTDVVKGSWYEASVGWASSNDIVKGFNSSIFGPERSITREQMAVIMYNYASFKGIDVKSTAYPQNTFIDSADISSWAADAVNWAAGIGIIQGDTNKAFSPQNTATRAQVAVILQRFVNTVK